MPTFRCQYCLKPLPTRAGVNHHIAKSRQCHKKWQDSLAAISTFTVNQDEAEEPVDDPGDRAPSPVPSNDDEDDPMCIADEFVPPAREESPPPPEPIPRSQRATVEEVPDEGDPENFGRFVEPFEGAGMPLGTGETLFERMRTSQTAEGTTEFFPFKDGEEWDLAQWLSKNVSQTATDEYLALPIVC